VSLKRIPRIHRRWYATLAVATAVATGFAAVVAGPSAYADTLFSDNFEDGNANGWSSSGGSWSVVSDGSLVDRQSNATSERARHFAGSASWTNYVVQARVKPVSFNGTGVVAIAARAVSSTRMYRLALTNANRVELQAMNGSAITVLGALSFTVSTSTFVTVRLQVNGSAISGSVNGTQVGSANDTSNAAGRIGLFTEFASASFDDVTVDTVGATPTSSPPASSGPPPSSNPPSSNPPSSNPPPTTGLVGWATQGGGTTGGAGGPTVTVTSLAALTSAASSSTTQIVRVNGNFTCSADVRVAANKTILGVGSGSGLTGCGLSMRDVSNVIVRNLRISFVQAGNGNGDAIHIDHATRLWIDHNELFSDTSHGTDFYDGLLDITHAADFITVSWNYLHSHIKCSLVGHSDSNASEDTGHLRVTYHHNRFDTCDQRNPRVRFGNPVHVFNNYYNNITLYAIASTDNAGLLVEGNYFENTPDPFHLGQADSGPGTLVARNNTFVNSGTGQTGGSVASIPYPYTLDASAGVKASVVAGAGVGKIST
jgi:pectate lyase